MAVAALVLYLLWFALAFGLRTLMAVRRTGDSGFRGISGRPFTLEWWAGVLFAVALLVGVAAPVADLVGVPLLTDVDAVRYGGLAIAMVGIALTLAAQISMGDSWRIGVDERERTALVTDGAFAASRNPIFTAMAITAVGLAGMVPNLIAVFGVVALIGALELQVRGVEEPYLRRVHGADYEHYIRRTGRFLPGIGRLGSA
jgi:protein-S-isoprenylcysteine O-methyltransferase Ste14